jgi:hypothetical protein
VALIATVCRELDAVRVQNVCIQFGVVAADVLATSIDVTDK